MARNRVGIHSLYNVKDLPEQIPQGYYVIIIKGIERMVCISEYGIYLTIAKANVWQKLGENFKIQFRVNEAGENIISRAVTPV